MNTHTYKDEGGEGKADAGFTLVEVLVTLALLSVMAALMLLVAGQFRGLVDRQADLIARQEAAAIVRHLAGEISVARPLPLMGVIGAQMSYMSGGAASLDFVAVVNTGSTSTGLRDVRIAIRPGKSLELIEVRQLRRRPHTIQSEPEIVLAEDVEAFSLRYFIEGDWIEQWQSRIGLPRVVEINLSIKRNGRIISSSAVAPISIQ